MTLFDRYIAVDWSAASKPTGRSGENGIWVQSLGRDGINLRDNPRTRAAALALLEDELRRARDRGDRTLLGFDLSFGWPAGFAKALTERADWRALWDAFEAEITDGDDNAHDVFAWAAGVNARLPAPGPFWGDPHRGARPPAPPERKPADFGGLAELRHCELRMAGQRGVAPKSVWQLAYAGAVGAQSLLGVRVISKLRAAFPTSRIWPFETSWRAPAPKPGEAIIAELYFRLLGDGDTGETDAPKDARQVRAGAQRLAEWDAAGELSPLFECQDESLRDIVEREEGWTLGA